MKPRWVAEAIGATLLLLLPYLLPLLLPDRLVIYHHRLPIEYIAWGALADLAACALGGIAVLALLSRLSETPRAIAAAGAAALIGWRALGDGILMVASNPNLAAVSNAGSPPVLVRITTAWSRLAHPLLAGLVLLAVLLAWRRPRATRPWVRATRLILTAISCCGVWMVPLLIWQRGGAAEAVTFARPVQAMQSQMRAQRVMLQRAPGFLVQPAPHQRIVWILLDELSYNLVFDHPPPGQAYPNFAALRARSVSFGNIDPVGFYTDRIIPSLLAGKRIDQIRSAPDGRLFYLDEAEHRWQPFDPGSSLFGVAWSNGWNPAVAGWYNPYCRILARVTVNCSWRPGIQNVQAVEAVGGSQQPVVTHALALPAALLNRVLAVGGKPPARRTALLNQNIADYRSIMAHARALIDDDDLHFIFIHLPVPHPPGIYDRTSHRLRAGGNYLDNLVLADDTLGTLLQEIDATPSAGVTTVIISSDHSWRVPLWRIGSDWTQEEARLSQGRFDPRPVLLIHFPGQSSAANVAASTPELVEHELIAGMLRGQIRNQADMDAFLARSGEGQRSALTALASQAGEGNPRFAAVARGHR